MANRYLDGERPDPSPAAEADRRGAGRAASRASGRRSTTACSTRRSRTLWAFVGEANRFVDAEKPWELAKAAKAGDEAAAARLRAVLGDLVEACRLVGLAAAPFLPATAPRVLAQLGYA